MSKPNIYKTGVKHVDEHADLSDGKLLHLFGDSRSYTEDWLVSVALNQVEETQKVSVMTNDVLRLSFHMAHAYITRVYRKGYDHRLTNNILGVMLDEEDPKDSPLYDTYKATLDKLFDRIHITTGADQHTWESDLILINNIFEILDIQSQLDLVRNMQKWNDQDKAIMLVDENEYRFRTMSTATYQLTRLGIHGGNQALLTRYDKITDSYDAISDLNFNPGALISETPIRR
jgi:hypothetical protein